MNTKCRKSTFVAFFFFALSLTLHSCLDEINLEVPDRDLDRIAIRGKLIYGDPSTLEVSVAQVADFVQFSTPVPVRSAVVRLLDTAGNALAATSQQAGIYTATISKDQPDVRVEPGQAYRVEVLLPDGRMMISAPEMLWPVPKIEAIRKQVIVKDVLNEVEVIEPRNFGQFLLNTTLERPDQSGRSYLKWDFEGVYRFIEADISDVIRFDKPHLCYFLDPIGLDEVRVFDGSSAAQERLSEFLILEEILDHRFYRGFYLTVYQQSLSKNAFEYWSKVGELIVRDGSFLETFPAKIKGNFTNVEDPDEEVFGFFYATAQDTARVFIGPEEARFPFQFCPPIVPKIEFDNLEEICKNCLSRIRSTLQKPDYWED